MDTAKAVALAGIGATALVGIAGAGASWLTAREDRGNQRALAHDARVYDRRADAYVAALGRVRALTQEVLVIGVDPIHRRRFARDLKDANGTQRERVIAYGSAEAGRAYTDAVAVASKAFLDHTRHRETRFTADLNRLYAVYQQLEAVVHAEIG